MLERSTGVTEYSKAMLLSGYQFIRCTGDHPHVHLPSPRMQLALAKDPKLLLISDEAVEHVVVAIPYDSCTKFFAPAHVRPLIARIWP